MAEFYDPTSTRLIGGLKAPGGSISQAFSEGMNNRIGQRDTLQAMRERAAAENRAATEFGWKGEDRARALKAAEEAKRAAAAAAARNRALNAALAAGIKIPDAPFSALPPTGAPLPRPVDAPPPRPGLSFGAMGGATPSAPPAPPVSGGGGAPVLRGGGGSDRLGAPAPSAGPAFERGGRGAPAAVPMTYERFVAAARSGQPISMDSFVAAVEAGTLTAQQAADVQAMVESGYVPSDADVRAATAAGVTPTEPYISNPNTIAATVGNAVSDFGASAFGGRTRGEQAAIDAERARQAEAYAAANAPAPAAPSTETPAAPAAPARTTGPVSIQLPDGGTVDFDLGDDGTGYPTAPQANLTFGPQLGAVADRPDLSIAMRVMGVAEGQVAPPARVEQYVMQPERVGAEMQEALSVREELVRQAQVFQEFGETQRYVDTVGRIAELDDQIVDIQTAQGLIDLQFNSPQRLEAALSYKTGWDIRVQPNSVGTFDVFANGQLWERMDRNQLGAFAQSMLDEAYAAKQAEREDERFKTQLEIEKTIAIEGAKTDYGLVLAGRKADLETQQILLRSSLDPSNVEIVKDDATGIIHIWNKVEQKYVGTIEQEESTVPNTGETVMTPVFKPRS